MQKIELTISPNYVPSWTIVDAVRELFQNALDQQEQVPDNTMDWDYSQSEEKLYITNKSSVLSTQSLLLGSTTKANDASTIGKFGEGYKIAALVLLRNNKTLTIYNYEAKEIWRPRFVKSRKFGTDILTFFIEKVNTWSKVPNANLTIEIGNITADEFYLEIEPSNLHIRHDWNIVEETKYGDVINLPGKVFVNGLWVCDYEPYKYGYNFKPEHLALDRDRKMVSDFDLRWLASKLWSSTTSDNVMELVEAGAADVAFLQSQWEYATNWNNVAVDRFKSVYGPEAIPVTTQTELESIPAGYKGVIVPSGYHSLIKDRIPIPDIITKDNPVDKLKQWFDGIKDKLDVNEIEEFESILEEL